MVGNGDERKKERKKDMEGMEMEDHLERVRDLGFVDLNF